MTHHLVLVFTEEHIYELRIHECMIVTEIPLAPVIWAVSAHTIQSPTHTDPESLVMLTKYSIIDIRSCQLDTDLIHPKHGSNNV